MSYKTMKAAAQTALDVQDACNLSGVLRAFQLIVSDVIWPEAHRLGEGTAWVNQHPICVLFLSKLVDLNGREADFFKAYDEVKALACQQEPAACRPAQSGELFIQS